MKSSSISRGIWILVLGAFLLLSSGCATYQRVNLGVQESTENRVDSEPPLDEGTFVRVTMKSGEKFDGNLVGLSKTELVLDRLGNYGDSDIVLMISEVDYVEVRDQSDGQIVGGWFAVLGTAALIAFFTTDWGLK